MTDMRKYLNILTESAVTDPLEVKTPNTNSEKEIDPEPSEDELYSDAYKASERRWSQHFDETVQRMKHLAGIPVSEDSIYPDADHMSADRHPNDEGSNGSTPDQKFGEDEIYDGEEGTAPQHKTSHPGECCPPKAPMAESTDEEDLEEAEVDEDGFSYKMAQAAKDGKKEVEIGGKKFKVTMSKDKAEKIA